MNAKGGIFLKQINKITVLWDFDGTLFDTYPSFTELFQKVMNDKIPAEEIYKQLKVSFSHAIKFYNLTEEQYDEIRMAEENWPAEKMPPFPGLEKVLQSVGKNVIMTHKNRREAERILSYYGFLDYFSEIVTIDDGFPRKPDPASYEYLHNRHQLDLVVGDRLLDILPGKALGISTCLFQNHQEGADYYLDNYHDFFEKVANPLINKM